MRLNRYWIIMTDYTQLIKWLGFGRRAPIQANIKREMRGNFTEKRNVRENC